ncbi:hypothetical protein HZP42_19110 [Elizabethkingia anophelis]|nr:hypothetical protein [Elizabethkingia anophelis]
MNTKYVKVPVSERLPDKEELYLVRSKQGFISEMKFYKDEEWLWKSSKEYWLEEKEDHSEEMLSMLERVVSFASLGEKVPDFLTHEIEQLINKVKDNG